MKNKAQFLVEVLITIVILIILTVTLFYVFSVLPRAIRYSEDSLIVFNLSNNYINILNGISRKNFQALDMLSKDTDYYLAATSSGYEIKEGRNYFSYIGENYAVWFRVVDPIFENDPAKKLIEIYVQTPSYIYSSPLILTNLREFVFLQDEWSEATTSIITVNPTTTIKQFSTSSNLGTNGEVYLP